MSKQRIFGIGLNKTGTTSLKRAFQALGYAHFDRRPKAFRLYKKGQFDALFAMIDPFETFEDWPWPLMVPQLLDRYGDTAKYILTRRRSAEVWVESLKSHSLKTHPINNPRLDIFGFEYPHGAEAAHSAFYNRHCTEMERLFEARRHQLLDVCWETGDGWPELCGFLNVPVPDRAFPHANRSATAEIDPARVAENEVRIAHQLAHLKKK